MVMQITDEVWQVGGGTLTDPADAAIYLVCFGGKAGLIDAGTGRRHVGLRSNIVDCGVEASQIEYLFLTHCHYDHTGGAEQAREAFGCKIVAHELDARYLEMGDNDVTGARWYGAVIEPFQVDHKITCSKETFALGNGTIQSFHTPGHSPGSVVYMVDSAGKKILFGQDVHGPLDATLLSDREDYIRSLKFLLTLKADILCEGHFGIFEGREDIEDFIRSFL
jgi:glyoxylase-like metal-dependent hydrolase (beta-lactamase superfamily II)